MKRKIIIIIPYISLLIIIIGIVIYQNTIINRQKLLLSKYKIQDSTLLSMMIEDENGDYAESENSEWPGEEYILNKERSGCENGGTLEYQDNNVYVKASSSDRCYVYFDKNGGLKIVAGMPHNLNANQAGMYRYQGSKDEVNNNYLCFGTFDTTTCLANQEKYLYRIIGITEEGAIKVIKNSSLGDFAWDSDSNNMYPWPNSTLFKQLNGTNNPSFLNTDYVDNTWAEFIMDYNWSYGNLVGNYAEDKNYFEELETGKENGSHAEKVSLSLKGTEGVTCSNVTIGANIGQEVCYKYVYQAWDNIQAKIGLLSLIDVFWAAQKDGFNCSYRLSSSELTACTNSYLPLMDERIMVNGGYSAAADAYASWQIKNGTPASYNVYDVKAPVRPVFYIKPNIALGGSGTINDPYVIKK